MDTAVALSGWNVQLKLDEVDEVDEERIAAFFEEYWQGAGGRCSVLPWRRRAGQGRIAAAERHRRNGDGRWQRDAS